MRIAILAISIAAYATAARADEAAYAAIYYQGADQITLNAQATPIPVPQVGSVIEVSDQGRTLAGYVRRVAHSVQRSSGAFPFRFYTVQVEIASTPPATAAGMRAYRR